MNPKIGLKICIAYCFISELITAFRFGFFNHVVTAFKRIDHAVTYLFFYWIILVSVWFILKIGDIKNG